MVKVLAIRYKLLRVSNISTGIEVAITDFSLLKIGEVILFNRCLSTLFWASIYSLLHMYIWPSSLRFQSNFENK